MPANTAYICRVRTDIPAAALQWLDLKPNTSQRNPIYSGTGQTGYLRTRVASTTMVTAASGGNDITVGAQSGVSAYLMDHVESGGLAAGTGALSDANCNTIAAALIAILDAGTPLTLALVNAALSATAANTELTNAGGSASTGSLVELLKIMSGGIYEIPAGAATEIPTGTFNPLVVGSFDDDGYRQIFVSGGLQASVFEGHLAEFASATFDFGGTLGAALVVYDFQGNVLT